MALIIHQGCDSFGDGAPNQCRDLIHRQPPERPRCGEHDYYPHRDFADHRSIVTSQTVDGAREPAEGRNRETDDDHGPDAVRDTSRDAAAPNIRQLPFALFGSKSAPRPLAPEPSLLPHLARLIPNWAVQNVLDLAWDYGRIGNDQLPPWVPLWEATFGGLSTRYFDLTHHYMGPISSVTQLDVDIARAGYYNERLAGQALLERLSFSETGHNLIASRARLAPLMDDRFALDFMDDVDPRDLDAESARSILAVATTRLSSLSRDWVGLALDETNFEPHFSRLAHLAPDLPREMIGEVVAEVAEELATLDPPEWYRALVISRLAPHARNPSTFHSHDSEHRLWAPFLDRLAAAKRPKGQFGDVLRAHPSAVDLLRHTPPQEIAAEAVSYIRGADDIEPEEDRQAAPASVARERTLNASVYIDGTEHSDTAFVSGVRHLVAVSYSRSDLVPVTAAFGHKIRNDSAATTKLIVRLVFNGLVAESPLLLPLDPAVDAAPATFAITPGGAQESLTARIIIYAPNGIEIIESVVLSGDVVPTVEAARFHGNQLQLNRRVQVRRPLTDVTSAATASILVDQYVAISASATGVRVADVRSLHTRLGQLVELIEAAEANATPVDVPLAAMTTDDDDFDRAIADRSGAQQHSGFVELVNELAANGHALRVAVDQHLGDLSRERDLQMVQTNPAFDLPLELLYAGPEPSVLTPFCDVWARSRQQNGTCPSCSDNPTSAVCISHFWGTTKSIDRRSGLRPSIRTNLADALPFADAAIIAASKQVDPSISAGLHSTAESAFGLSVPAMNWNDWRLAAARNDGVLVALASYVGLPSRNADDPAANNDAGPRPTFMEIGGDHVALADIDSAFVGKQTGQPGPVVVLIPTGVLGGASPESAFAALVNHVGAPFVISALGRSIPAHAGEFAQIALAALASVRSKSLRDSVREIRRELLLRSAPSGFLVIGYGDGDWRRSS